MSGFANLMSAFRNIAGTAAPAVPPAIPNPAEVKTEVKTEAAPLDPFANLWEPPKPVEGVDPNAPQPLFSHKPEDLLAAARKQNFITEPTPEQLVAINKGGMDAFKVMQEMMNDAAQRAFANGADASTKLITSALDRSNFVKEKDVDKHIKSQRVTETLRADNPIFSNPAVAPIMKGLEAQILLKNPESSAAEVAQMARDYFAGVTEMFTAPDKRTKQEEANKGETDWSRFV